MLGMRQDEPAPSRDWLDSSTKKSNLTATEKSGDDIRSSSLSRPAFRDRLRTPVKSPHGQPAKKILMLLSNCFDPDPRVHNEARALLAAGYEVTLIAWDRDHKRLPHENIDNIKIERIRVRSTHGRGTTQIFFLFLFWLKASLRILTKEFDLLHCHDFDTLPLGFFIAKLRRRKIVYDAHENYADMLTGSVHPSLLKAIRLLENVLIRRIDLLITVGESLKLDFERRGATHVCIVGNWKNPSDYQFPDEILKATRRQLGIPPASLIITFITWLARERQLPALLQAVKSSDAVHLIVGGDGPLRDLVAKEALASENITYLGYVKPNDVPLYTRLADIIYYGFDKNNPNAKYSAPNKLFEALAAGTAVISGDFGEIGRIVREENIGMITNGSSSTELTSILDKIRHSSRLETYKANASRLGRTKYNWNHAAHTLCKEYRTLFPHFDVAAGGCLSDSPPPGIQASPL